MSYPPFQYKMGPIRMSQPHYYDPYAYPITPEIEMTVKGRYNAASPQLPSREHPLNSCDMHPSNNINNVQKYFWGDDAYDLPVYDPSIEARKNKYRDVMTLGQFNAGGKYSDKHNKPFLHYNLTQDGTFAPYPELEPIKCEKNIENFTGHQWSIYIVVVILICILILILNKKFNN